MKTPVNKFLQFCKNYQSYILGFATILVVMAGATYKAWVTEDAFITLRVVDNFVNGYGLRWNIAERVQVYTHPLWMFYLSGVYYFTHEPFYTTIFASLFIVFIVACTVAYKNKNKPTLFVIFGLGFAASKALTDYSTSGLEFPFTMLGLTMIFLEFRRENYRDYVIYLWGCFLALNRLDICLLAIPACLYAFYYSERKWSERIGVALLCGMPLFLWLLFATFYYGYPFPNTYYAKLHGAVPKDELWGNGIKYFRTLFIRDLASAITMFLPIFLVKKNRVFFVFYAACAIYLLYILSIGGDFMMGRFFCPIIYLSLLLISFEFKPVLTANQNIIKYGYFVGFAVLYNFVLLIQPHDRAFIFGQFADERAFYVRTNWIFSDLNWEKDGLVVYGRDLKNRNQKFLIHGNIGMLGYILGPDTHIVDTHALSEPLLARLPKQKQVGWRVGHIRRDVPPGYEEFLKKGDSKRIDKDLKIYAKVIRELTQGHLFNKRRLQMIIDFNAGVYNPFLKNYRYKYNPILKALE